ncbi:GNAT family N-acetyltransferase [Prauserella cavernicola]|uniref:GNAT family N-acetyltransferase n=1 Tax=Prauserella cavernicola TaxID=2800127 RepID=A0A934V455_9PSEU|nr:GNAT family N-acetyltransferase [Prauserella cavernicola]MBK1783223.1 GNAT family N-acetyltransferase [Prauserella cavernicola]
MTAPLATLSLPSGPVELRRAQRADLPGLVGLLADDPLGRARESEDLEPYERAFAAIDADPAHLLVVATRAGALAGTLQLSVLPGLPYAGALRAQIEGVFVAAADRGEGLGAGLLTWAIDEARERGCVLVQLTSDRSRTGAHRFYERLGFVASHEGFKLAL